MALTYLQTATDGSSQTTYTFSSQNIGTAASNRFIIVTITGRSGDGTNKTLSSVTIGGVTATLAASGQWNTGNFCGAACANVPTGTTGDIVVTFSDTMSACSVSAYSENGLSSATVIGSGGTTSDAGSITVVTSTGGVIVGIAKDDDGTATCTWTGLTENFDSQDGDSNDISGASKQETASPNVSVTKNLAVNADWTGSPTRPVAFVASYGLSETLSPINVVTSVQAPSLVLSSVVSPSVISVATSVQAPIVSFPTDGWTKQTRNTGSWTNQTKN